VDVLPRALLLDGSALRLRSENSADFAIAMLPAPAGVTDRYLRCIANNRKRTFCVNMPLFAHMNSCA
jgi:hypothetical protein